MASPWLLCVFFIVLLPPSSVINAQRTYLRADGNSANTYNLIDSVLGGTAHEVPDCIHSVPHITQTIDPDLGIPVFNFTAHVAVDNDRCEFFDRQRTEIKTYAPSQPHLKCFNGDSVSYSWDVKLDSEFEPSTAFTHIFQIKAVDGDDAQPFITITPRLWSNGPKWLQLTHSGQDSAAVVVWQEDLAKYLGFWIHITVEMTCKVDGMFHIRMKETQSGETLMFYNNASMELWRSGNTFQRPKWGIYRGLGNQINLRDENIYFNNFCIAKGDPLCS